MEVKAVLVAETQELAPTRLLLTSNSEKASVWSYTDSVWKGSQERIPCDA